MIRAALAIGIKDLMGTEKIREREEELLKKAFDGLSESIPGLHILALRHQRQAWRHILLY